MSRFSERVQNFTVQNTNNDKIGFYAVVELKWFYFEQ